MKYISLCVVVLCLFSCKKNNNTTQPQSEPISTQNITITAMSPMNAYPGDTVSIFGSFKTDNVEELKLELFLDRDRSLEFDPIIPYNSTPTELQFVMPYIESDREEIFTVSLRINTPDTIFYGHVTDSFRYFWNGPGTDFWPVRLRAGQTIVLNFGGFDNVDYKTIKVKFSGTSEWLSTVGIDTFSYEHISSGYAYRVPAHAKTGPIEIWAPKRKIVTSDSTLVVLPDMPSLQKGVWVQRADYGAKSANTTLVNGGGRSDASIFTINDKAYIACGTSLAPLDGAGNYTVWEYDPKHNAWMQKRDFPGRRFMAASFTLNGKGYMVGGADGGFNVRKDMWEYDPESDTWQQKADFPGAAREHAVGFAAEGKGYVGSGTNGKSVFYDDFYSYDPTVNSWSPISSIPTKRSESFAFVIDDKAYVGGGKGENFAGLYDMYVYDPKLDTWQQKTGMPGNYDYTLRNAAFTLNGKAYVGLGAKGTSPQAVGCNLAFVYSPSTDSWVPAPNVGTKDRAGGVGFAINGVGYFGLGAAPYETFSLYDIWGYIP